MPLGTFSPDPFPGQFPDAPWYIGQQILTPTTLAVLVGLVSCVALLALLVASLSGDLQTAAEQESSAARRRVGQRAADSLAAWFGSSCGWTCQWRPRRHQPAA